MHHLVTWSLLFLLSACVVSLDVSPLRASPLGRKLEDGLNKFKIDLHMAMERARLMNRHDSFTLKLDERNGFVEAPLMLSDPKQPLLALKKVQSVSKWVSVESVNGHFIGWVKPDGTFRIGTFNGPFGDTTLKSRFKDEAIQGGRVDKLKHFLRNGLLWLVASYQLNGRKFLSVYQVNGTSGISRQKIELTIGADIDVLQTNSGIYLVIGDREKVQMYEWKETQFDSVAEKAMVGIKAVTFILIGPQLLVATVQSDPSSPGKSQVLEFRSVPQSSPSLTTIQYIDTKYDYLTLHQFKVHGRQYLLFNGKQTSSLYWWIGGTFISFQRIEGSSNVYQADSVTLVDGEVLLSLLQVHPDGKRILTFYTQGRDTKFAEIFKRIFSPKSGLSGIKFVSLQKNYIYLLTSSEKGKESIPSAFQVKLVPEFYHSNIVQQDELAKCLSYLNQDVTRREQALKKMLDTSHRIWVSNKPQIVKTPVIVEGRITIEGNATIGTVFLSKPHGHGTVFQETQSGIANRVEKVKNNIYQIQKDMETVVFKDRNQNINGKVTFVKPVKAKKAVVNTLADDDIKLNGINLATLKDKVLTREGDQVISGKWTFAQGVKIDKLQVAGKINGISTDDIVLRNSPFVQEIKGPLTFHNLIAEKGTNVLQGVRVNGLLLDDIVRRDRGPNIILGRKTIRKAVFEKGINVIGDIVNKVHLPTIAAQAIPLSSPIPQVINGPIIFQSTPYVNNLKVDGLINKKINVTHLDLFTVKKLSASGQVITGKKIFTGTVHINGDLIVKGKINNVDINNDLITTNTPQEITTPLIFQNKVTFNSNLNTGLINGVNLKEEAVLKNVPGQVITARKRFLQPIHVDGNVEMTPDATIDGVDPSLLDSIMVRQKNVQLFGPIRFSNMIVNGNIRANKGITHGNGREPFMISDLPQKVWMKSVPQTISTDITFNQLRITNLTTAHINGFRFPDDFVLQNSKIPQVITGKKTFVGEVVSPFWGLSIEPGVKVNGIDINAVARNMVKNSKDPNESGVRSAKVISKLVVKGNIYAKTINGLDWRKDILLNNVRQTVNSKLVFTNPETVVRGTLDVKGKIDVKDTVNDVQIKSWIKDVVLLNDVSNRSITKKHFDRVNVGDLKADGRISGIHLDTFRKEVVLLNRDEVITGKKNFTGDLHFQNGFTATTINGINIKDWEKRIVRKNRPGSISGKKTILGNLVLEQRNLHVDGFINGINLGHMVESAVKKNEQNIISAPFTINGNVNAKSVELSEGATLDGIRLKDLVFLNEDSVINSTLVFTDNVYFEGPQLLVKTGIISGCNLPQLIGESVSLDATHMVLKGRKILNSLTINGNLSSPQVNNVNVKQFSRSIVTLDSNEDINGEITFTDDVSVDNLIIKGTINGVDLIHILQDAVSKNNPRPQIISGNKVFLAPISITGANTRFMSNVKVNGRVNGVDIVLLNNTLVTKDGHQIISGRKTFVNPGDAVFNGNVNVQGLVGKPGDIMIKIPDDLILLAGDEVIQSRVVFENETVVRRNLFVDGLVDGVNLEKFKNERISLTQDQSTASNMVFDAPTRIDTLIVRKTINGIPVNDFVRRDRENVLFGEYIIEGGATFRNNLTLGEGALFNGLSVSSLFNRIVDTRVGGHLPGTTVLSGPISIADLTTETLNKVHINSLVERLKNTSSFISSTLNSIDNRLSEQRRSLSHIMSLAHSVPIHLHFFSLGDRIRDKTVTHMFPLSSLQTNNETQVMISSTLLIHRFTRYEDPLTESCPLFSSFLMKVHTSPEKVTLSPLPASHPFSPASPIPFSAFPITKGIPSFVPPFFVFLNATACSIGGQKPQFLTSSLPNVAFDSSASFRGATITAVDHFMYGDFYVVIALKHQKDIKAGSRGSNELSSDGVYIYRFNPIADSTLLRGSLHQTLKAYAPTDLSIMRPQGPVGGAISMAVTNSYSVHGVSAPSLIYSFDLEKRKFVPISTLSSSSPTKLQFMTVKHRNILAVANEMVKMDEDAISYSFPAGVDVWEMKPNNQTQLLQTITFPGVVSMDSFWIPSAGHFLAIASSLKQETRVYKFRGINAFDLVIKFPTPGVTDVSAFFSEEGDVMLAIGSKDEGHNKIVRGFMTGPPLSIFPPFNFLNHD